MVLKSFYNKFGYKELVLRDSNKKNKNLVKNNFNLNKMELFLPVFESSALAKRKKTKLNRILFLYFFYQFFFNKNVKIIFKNTLGKPRKTLNKNIDKYGYDVLGFSVLFQKKEVYTFFEQFFNDFFFIFFFGGFLNNFNKDFSFKYSRKNKLSYLFFKLNLNSFFNFQIFQEVLKDLNIYNLNSGSVKIYFTSDRISHQVNSLRFIQFPFIFKKYRKKI